MRKVTVWSLRFLTAASSSTVSPRIEIELDPGALVRRSVCRRADSPRDAALGSVGRRSRGDDDQTSDESQQCSEGYGRGSTLIGHGSLGIALGTGDATGSMSCRVAREGRRRDRLLPSLEE
jgi:hypothetical protein